MNENKKNNDQNILWRYAGLSTQFLISLGLATFAGIKIDGWIKLSFPVFVWLLPLTVLIIMLVKIVKDTSKK